MYSRELEKNFCISWYNDQKYPDLGTKEMQIID